MKYPVRNILLFLLLTLVLYACKSPQQDILPNVSEIEPFEKAEVLTPNAQPTESKPIQKKVGGYPTLEDSQGNVTISVTPINFNNPGETIDFIIQMETHSVDLTMDLALLSTLTNNAEIEISPVKWDAPLGGHHVTGILSFPVITEGGNILYGAQTMELIIRDVDAPKRIYTWQLN